MKNQILGVEAVEAFDTLAWSPITREDFISITKPLRTMQGARSP